MLLLKNRFCDIINDKKRRWKTTRSFDIVQVGILNDPTQERWNEKQGNVD